MSRVISFRTDDEIAEVIDDEVDKADDDLSRAQVTKELVEEAADARATPLWLQIGMSNRDAARLEDLLKQGEDESDLARELLGEALEARDRDILDELEVDDELRDRVEAVREEGETLDDAVRRLVRQGAEVSTPAAKKLETARIWAERFVVMFIVFGLALSAPGDVLSRTLPIAPITGEQVIAGAVLVTLFFYFTNRAGALRAGRGGEG